MNETVLLWVCASLLVACSKDDPGTGSSQTDTQPDVPVALAASRSPAAGSAVATGGSAPSIGQIMADRRRAQEMCEALSAGKSCGGVGGSGVFTGPFVDGRSWIVAASQDPSIAKGLGDAFCADAPAGRCRTYTRGVFNFKLIGEPSGVKMLTATEAAILSGADTTAPPLSASSAGSPTPACYPCQTQEDFDIAWTKHMKCCPVRACEGDSDCTGGRVCCRIPMGSMCTDAKRCRGGDRIP